MNLSKIIPSFPLLGKELTEQASRKSTYTMRFMLVIGTGLILFFFIGTQDVSDVYAYSRLGEGIFGIVMLCEFFAALVVLPGTMAAVITSEKENNSLELLFLTQMRPWEIIAQKYFGRIIPVIMFFFLGLPFLAIGYSFGGINNEEIYYMVAFFFCLILQIGAFSIMFSAYFTTTAASVTCSYIATAFFVVTCCMILDPIPRITDSFFIIPPFQLGSVGLFLFMSVIFLKGSPHRTSKSAYRVFLENLDRFWTRMNKLLAGGIVLVKDGGEPGTWGLTDDPVEWHEKYKSATGRFSYKIRLALMLSIPAIAFVFFSIGFNDGSRIYETCSALFFAGYLLSVTLFIVVLGSSVVASERIGQRLDVLLTTAVSARDIVNQKMKKGRTYIWTFAFPITIISCVLSSGLNFNRYYHNDEEYRLRQIKRYYL